jgi:hypothetical protein
VVVCGLNAFSSNFSVSFHVISHDLTSLAPQPPHGPVEERRPPWSDGFDRIVRNEGVTGSNPVSSTKHPGQSDSCEVVRSLLGTLPRSLAPRVPHMT